MINFDDSELLELVLDLIFKTASPAGSDRSSFLDFAWSEFGVGWGAQAFFQHGAPFSSCSSSGHQTNYGTENGDGGEEAGYDDDRRCIERATLGGMIPAGG